MQSLTVEHIMMSQINNNNNANANHDGIEREFELVTSILQQKYEKYPTRVKSKVNGLVRHFLGELEDTVHKLLTDNRTDEGGEYLGFDFDRDSIEGVEAAIETFPSVLARRDKAAPWSYPIEKQAHSLRDDTFRVNVHAVSFLPLLARLGDRHGLFREEDRAGLLIDDDAGFNALHRLVGNSDNDVEDGDEEHHELVDVRCVDAMGKLRETGHMKKTDVREYDLLQTLCRSSVFAERRFLFLSGWDPDALRHVDDDGDSPLQCAAEFQSIEGFKTVLDVVIRYFPRKEGIKLLFQTNCDGATPFETACLRHGRENVMEIVESVLTEQHSDSTPFNAAEVFLSAATDENTGLDGVFFVLRRQPDVLQKLLSPLVANYSQQ